LKGRTILPILLLFLMAVGTLPGLKAQTLINVVDVSWGAMGNPIEVEPGDRNVPLEITLVNYQASTIEDVSSKLILPEGMSDSLSGSGVIEKSYAGRIQPGQSFSFTYSIDIGDEVSIGSHKAKLKLFYKNVGSSGTIEQDYDLTLRVTGKSRLELSLDRTEIPAGGKSELVVHLKNEGTAQASNVEVSVTFPSSQSTMGGGATITLISPDGHWSFKSLGPGEEAELEMLVHAPEGTARNSYQITFTISYYNVYGSLVQLTRKLGVDVGDREVDEAKIDLSVGESELYSGRENLVTLFVKNSGEVDLKDVKVDVAFPTGMVTIEGSSSFRVEELKAGEVESFNLKIFVPEGVGDSAQPMTVSLSYEDENGNKRAESKSIGLVVRRLGDVSVADVSWGALENPIEVEPGDRNVPLQITLVNHGSDPITDIRGELILPSGFTSDGKDRSTKSHPRTVTGGASFTLDYVIDVEKGLSLGEYNATLILTYRKVGGGEVFTCRERIGLELKGRSDLKLDLVHDGIKAGSVNEATLILRNEGSAPASDITLSLGQTDGVAILNSDRCWRVKELGPNGSEEFRLELFVPASLGMGSVNLPITLTYYDTNGYLRTLQRWLGFKVERADVSEAKVELHIRPEVLIPAQENHVILEVSNLGESELYNVKVDLVTAPLTLLGGDGHVEFGRIGPNSSSKVPLNLFVPSGYEGSSGFIKATLSYEDSQGNGLAESRQIGYRVGGLNETMDVRLEVMNPVLEPGSTNLIRVNVTNVGKAKLSRVRLWFNPPQLTTGSPISILSVENRFEVLSLEPNESRVLELPVFVGESASGASLQLPVKLKLVDESGVEKLDERSLGITVTRTSRESKLALKGGGEVLAGKVNEIELKLTNTLDYGVSDVTLEFEGGRGLNIIGSEKVYIPSLGPEEERSVRLSVFPDASLLADKVATLSVKVEYKDPGGIVKTEEDEIGLISRGQIILSVPDVKFSYIAGIPTVTGDLLNEGNVDAFFSRAKLEGVMEGEEVFIGDISQGVTVPFSIPVKVPEGLKEGTYNLTLRVTYRDGFREERVANIPISVRFYSLHVEEKGSSEQLSPFALWPIYGIAAIVVAVLVYVLLKRRT